MLRRTKVIVAIVAAAAAGAALYIHHAPRDVSRAQAGGARFRPGLEYRYALAWSGQQHGVIGTAAGAPAQELGTVDIAAKLFLRGLSDDGRQTLVEAHLERAGRHDMSILGQRIYPDDKSFDDVFAGRNAYLQVDHAGHITSLRFAAADSSTYKDTMQWLLTQTQFIVPAAGSSTWQDEEEGPFGRSSTAYRRLNQEAVERTRSAYTSVTIANGLGTLEPDSVSSLGSTRGEIDASGRLTHLHMDEHLRKKSQDADVASIQLDLVLENVAKVDRPIVAWNDLEARQPGELVMSREMQEALLRKTAAGLTTEGMISDLTHFSDQMPDKNRWMWRAVGLLQLDPEAAKALIGPFGNLPMPAKKLVLDLLASASTEECQAVMRTILAGDELRRQPEYPLLLQRMSLVETPTPDNAQFLQQAYETNRGSSDETALASAVALGSTVGHLHGSSDDAFVAASQKYNDVLRNGLAAAGDDEPARRAFVMALGNTKLEENSSLVADAAKDSSAGVRSTAANSLAGFADEGSFQALLGLAADGDPVVARAAFTSLSGRTLSVTQVSAVATLIASGRTPLEADPSAVMFLTVKVGISPAVSDALRYLFERNPADLRLRAIILGVLGQS